MEAGQGDSALAAKEHQVKLGLKGVYYWLGKLGGVLKVPRKTHAQKDAARQRSFSKRSAKAQELERGWWKAGAHVGGR